MIYVYAGNGNPLGMNTGITLKNNQWLQGSGFSFPIFTSFGLTEIPAQTTNWPTISTASGNAVTLANNNIVSGFNIISRGSAISGTNVTSVRCSHNKLSGSTGFDIDLSNVAGAITINENTSLSQNGLSLSTSKDVTIKIENNYFLNPVPQTAGTPVPGSQNINLLFTGRSNSTAIITLNELAFCQDGSTITTRDNAQLSMSFESNDIHDIQASAPYALSFEAILNSTLVAVIQDNLWETPTPTGLNFLSSASSNSLFYVFNNTGTYSASESGTPFYFAVDTNASSTLSLQNNIANSNGYVLSNGNTSTFNVASSDFTIDSVEAENSGTITTFGTITFISPPSSIPVIE
jgi:hypothetical protein